MSDNHEYVFTNMLFSNFTFNTKNVFNYYYDKHKVKLLKSWSEIKIQDLIITASKIDKLILDLHTFTLTITEDIVYYHESKEANIRSSLNSEMPNLDIVISTKELDKFIELMICIIVGSEKLSKNKVKAKTKEKFIENYSNQNFLNFNFENINMIVHDDEMQAEMNNVSFTLRIEEQKFIGAKIDILFSPININAFSKKLTKYCSNMLIQGFKLSIQEKFDNVKIDIFLDSVKILVYDNHLIDAMKFISEFLTYSLRGAAKSNHKKMTQKPKEKVKKEECNLIFKKIIIFYYVEFDDLLTLKISDYSFAIDNNMSIPKIKIYHQSLISHILRNRTKILDLNRFYIAFKPKQNETNIEFNSIDVNFYCFELMHPITKISIYYNFFPLWIIYYMSYKHKVDEDYKQIYIGEFAKKDVTTIKFEKIYFKINQYLCSNAAIFHTNPSLIENENSRGRNTANYLKSIKSEQIEMKVSNFVMKISGHFEKETGSKEEVITLLTKSKPSSNSFKTQKGYFKKVLKSKFQDIFLKLNL